MAEELDPLVLDLTAEANDYNTVLDNAEKQLMSSTKMMERHLQDASDTLTRELDRQVKTFGMGAREAQIYALQMDGASRAQLAAAKAADKQITALEKERAEMEKSNQLAYAVVDLTQDLQAQVAMFGKAGREAQLYKMQLQGATDVSLKLARVASAQLDALEADSKAMERAKGITQQFRTPQQQFIEKQLEINDLLKRGAIDAGTYARAMYHAKKELGTGWDAAAKALNPMQTGMMQVGRSVQSLGRDLSLYVTAPIVALGASSVYEFGRFDNAMTEARAIMGKVAPDMQKEIQKTVLDLSELSKFTPTELADGMKQLAAAGLTVENSMKALPVVEKFATAGAFDLEQATQLLTDSQSAMGLAVKDATQNQLNMIKVSDALVKAGDQSTASPKQFAEALANGAADAKMWGAEIETVMAVLDAYASKGNKGAAAGSDMARSMKLLKKAYSEQREEFEKNGIKVADEAGNYRNFIDVIADLEKAMQGLSGTQQTDLLKSLGFEALAQTAILPLVGMSDAMKEWEVQQKNAADYTKNVAKIQMESFTNTMKQLWNQLTVIRIEIGSMLIPMIQKMAAGVKYGIDVWKTMSQEGKTVTLVLAGIAAAVGPVVLALGTGVVACGALQAAATTLGIQAYVTAAGLMAMQVAAAGLAIGGIFLVAKAMYDIQPDITDYNDAIARSAVLEKELMDAQAARAGRTMKQAEGLQGDEKVAFLAKELDLAQKNAQSYANQMGKLNKEIDEMSTTWNTLIGFKPLASLKTDLVEAEGHLKTNRDRVKELETALNEAKGIKSQDQTIQEQSELQDEVEVTTKEIQKLIDKLKLEEATFGLTSGEVLVYKLQLRGASEEQIKLAKASAETLKQMELQKKSAEADTKKNKAIQDLKIEAETYGMTARQAKIYRMQIEGASKEEIDAAKASDAHLSALEKQKKATEEAAAVTKKFQDPVAKMTEEQGKLKKMLDDQLISVDVYKNALKDLQKETDKEKKVRFSASGVEAVELGTTAMLAKLNDYYDAQAKGPKAKGAQDKRDQQIAQAAQDKKKEEQQVMAAQPAVPVKKHFRFKQQGGPQPVAVQNPVASPIGKSEDRFAMMEAYLKVLAEAAEKDSKGSGGVQTQGDRVILTPANLKRA